MYTWLLATLFIVQGFQYVSCVTNNSSNDSVFTLMYKSFSVDFNLGHFLNFLRCLCDGNRQTCHVITSPGNDKQNVTYNVRGVFNHDKEGIHTKNLTVSCTVRENQMGNKETNLTIDCHQTTTDCHTKITITQTQLLNENACLFYCFSVNWLDTDDVAIVNFNSNIILVNNCTTQCQEQTIIKKAGEKDDVHNLSFILLLVIILIIAISFIIYLLRYKLRKLYTEVLKTRTSPGQINNTPLQAGLAGGGIYCSSQSVRDDGNLVKNVNFNRKSKKTNTVAGGCGRETMTFNKSKDLNKSNFLGENCQFKNVESINDHIYMEPDLVENKSYNKDCDITNKPEICGGFPRKPTDEDKGAVEHKKTLLHSGISVYEKPETSQYYVLEVNETCETNTSEERPHSDGVRYELACPVRDSCRNGNLSDEAQHVYSRLRQREEVLVNEYDVLPIKK